MKIHIILCITIMSLLVLASGCKKQETGRPLIEPFIGGKEGLRMGWVDGLPPETILDEGKMRFGIGVQLANVGEEYLGQGAGYVEVIGINPKDFNKRDQNDLRKFFLVPMREAKRNIDGTVIAGGQSVVDFSDLKYIPDLKGNTEVKVRANLCYDYRTKTSTKICAKRELIEVGKAKICDVAGTKDPKNSGGTVHITAVRESPLGEGKIQVLFEVEHVGDKNNIVFKRGTECDDSIANPNRNVVYARITSEVYGKKADCVGFDDPDQDNQGGYFTLYGGQKRAITCTYDINDIGSAVFEPLFTVDLFYRYYQYIEKSILIRDVTG
ncbi:hypothetical protein HY639_05420 [Candidatus Woesearchaeota archaeon]|nr:hypothetical protein [Candidatus Woesearchaeota archaeon]